MSAILMKLNLNQKYMYVKKIKKSIRDAFTDECEFANLRALRAFVPYAHSRLRALPTFVPCVLSRLTCLDFNALYLPFAPLTHSRYKISY